MKIDLEIRTNLKLIEFKGHLGTPLHVGSSWLVLLEQSDLRNYSPMLLFLLLAILQTFGTYALVF